MEFSRTKSKRKVYILDFVERKVKLKESEILDMEVTVMPVFCGALGLNLKS